MNLSEDFGRKHEEMCTIYRLANEHGELVATERVHLLIFFLLLVRCYLCLAES